MPSRGRIMKYYIALAADVDANLQLVDDSPLWCSDEMCEPMTGV